jgi:hypothetical protein
MSPPRRSPQRFVPSRDEENGLLIAIARIGPAKPCRPLDPRCGKKVRKAQLALRHFATLARIAAATMPP